MLALRWPAEGRKAAISLLPQSSSASRVTAGAAGFLLLIQCREHGLRRKTRGPARLEGGAKYFGVERRGARAAPLRNKANRQHKGRFPGRPQEISTVPFWQRGSQQGESEHPKQKAPPGTILA